MALDFKSMSTEKKVTFCGAALIAALSLIAFIVCLCVPSTQEAILKASIKAAKNMSLTDALSGKLPNVLSGINWTLFLGFVSALAVAAIYYFKELKISLVPANVPMKFVVPGIVVLTSLFAWIYLSTGIDVKDGFSGWMADKGTFWAILLILCSLAYICVFVLAILEKKDNILSALPEILLALVGFFFLLGAIGGLAFNEESESISLVKISLVLNALCMTGFGVVTCLNENKQ